MQLCEGLSPHLTNEETETLREVPQVTQLGSGRAELRTRTPTVGLLPHLVPSLGACREPEPWRWWGISQGMGSLGRARTLEWNQIGTMGPQRPWWPWVGYELEPGAAVQGGRWTWEIQCSFSLFQFLGQDLGTLQAPQLQT